MTLLITLQAIGMGCTAISLLIVIYAMHTISK